MKLRTVLIYAFLFFYSNISLGQKLTTKDSIEIFYNDLFDNLESKYLNRAEINWNQIKAYTFENVFSSKSFEASLDATTLVFDSIKCNHCQLFAENGFYQSTLNQSFTQDDFSVEFLLEYQKKTPFEVKLIGENIGYINIPGMLMINLSQDSLNRATQKMYNKVVKLAKQNTIGGWIIDLRFNIGGNVYPMLSSLHYLLGDNIMYKELDGDGNIVKTNILENGGFFSGKEEKAKANISINPNLDIPVALIIGKMTGSAGENIAIAFKNRSNSIFIGEKSYGLLTGNDMVELPYNINFAISTCYIVDKSNVYRAYITPDELVSKKDNFDELIKDENILRSMQFINTQEK